MAKERRQFVCQECGYVSLKWLGRCPECQKWNSLTEEIEFDTSAPAHRTIGKASRQPEPIREIAASEEDRLLTGIREFDRVLGDGIVPGSVILIGGDPGIGKSTLLLQASDAVSRVYGTVLYVTGEESAAQTKLRANRLGLSSDALLVLCENDLEQIESHIAAVSARKRNSNTRMCGAVAHPRKKQRYTGYARGPRYQGWSVGRTANVGAHCGYRALF